MTNTQKRRPSLTMNALPIRLRFPVKHCVFVFRSHLRLCWHLLFPSLQIGCRLHVVLLEGVIDGGYYIVDQTEAFALTAFLGSGEAPGYFPVNGGCQLDWNDKGCIKDGGWGGTKEGPQRVGKLS